MEDYFAFLDDCSSILGEWRIHEHASFNPNSDEVVHDCVLVDPTDKYVNPKKNVSVWISLERRNFIKKYGRSRKKVYWAIYTETKAGRSLWDLAIQMLIPLKAFTRFPGAVVVVDPEKVFLHPKNYQSFVVSELVDSYGEDAVKEIGLVTPIEAAPNNGMHPTPN